MGLEEHFIDFTVLINDFAFGVGEIQEPASHAGVNGFDAIVVFCAGKLADCEDRSEKTNSFDAVCKGGEGDFVASEYTALKQTHWVGFRDHFALRRVLVGVD